MGMGYGRKTAKQEEVNVANFLFISCSIQAEAAFSHWIVQAPHCHLSIWNKRDDAPKGRRKDAWP